MRPAHRPSRIFVGLLAALTPLHASAHSISPVAAITVVRNTGVSALWILANISYAGMRAQGHPSFGWRVACFLFGFPGTLISLFAVEEGGGRAYGIELPKRGG